jgi:hypothetical protein
MSEKLQRVATEIERGTAKLGWDQPPALYALVVTEQLLAEPNLPDDIANQIRSGWDKSSDHLSGILQEQMQEDEVEDMLPRIAWPEAVAGAALTVERLIVPPEIEAEAPEDPDEAAAFIAAHPSTMDVRITVAALRSGDTWSLIRTKAFDSDEMVATGEALVPQLSELLLASLAPDQPA